MIEQSVAPFDGFQGDVDMATQFDQLMAANFSRELVAMEPEAEIVDEADAFDLDAFMLQQTTFGNLSLDDADTKKAIESEEGLEALVAPSLTHATLGNTAIIMAAAGHEMAMRASLSIFEQNGDDDDEAEEETEDKVTKGKLLFA